MSSRLKWLDVVKGLAILFVVIGHVGTLYGSSPDAGRAFHVIHDAIYCFHMPLFLFCSGYLLRGSAERKEPAAVAKERLAGLGIPYVVFSVAYWLIKVLAGGFVKNAVGLRDLLLIPLFPLSFLWYLYALLIITGLALLLYKKTQSWRGMVVIGLIFRILWECLSLVPAFSGSVFKDLIVTDVIKNTIWFALGLYVAPMVFDRMLRLTKAQLAALAAVLAAVLAGVCLAGWNETPFLRMLWALCGIAAVTALGMLIGKSSLLERLGRDSLPIYLMHGTILTLLKVVFDKLGVPLLGGLGPMFYGTAAAIALSLGIYAVCRRVPFLDALFYPVRYLFKKKQEMN